MRRFSGVAVNPGIAEGRAYVFQRQELKVEARSAEDLGEEKARLTAAAESAVAELRELVEKVREKLGTEFAHIFRSQQTVAEDEAMLKEVVERIETEKSCAEAALEAVFSEYRDLFAELSDDDYNKARAADIEDVYKRILRNLLGLPQVSLMNIPAGTVVIAEDLFPSDTAGMDPIAVVAMVTEAGGPTSHASILANNLGIPAAVQVADILEAVSTDDQIVVENLESGAAQIVVDPDEATRRNAREKAHQLEFRRKMLATYRGAVPRTTDGVLVTLSANIGSTEDLTPAWDAGARSVGLYRSEFLFLGTPTLPDEDRQYQAYRAAVERFPEGFVVFRTLDIGGDKTLPALSMPKEDNPFLGNRALRFSLSRPELFGEQLRAMLRASAHGKAKIMFPMVGGLEELEEALGFLQQARGALEAAGTPYDRELEVGIMIEVPSAVLAADALAKRVDFFSIGTNDLTQYLLAADRLNPSVARYYRTFDPSLFAAIRMVVEGAERYGCWVGVCGELGGNRLAAPLLLGLGVSELSMSPQMLDQATAIIRRGRMSDFQALAESVLKLDSHREIEALLTNYYTQEE